MDFKDAKSIYHQIADYVCEQILLERWKEGERVLSVRELAIELEVNPNTVLRAYDLLQNREIILNKRGIGYFAAADAIAQVKLYKRQEFVSTELPELIKTMQLLQIDFNELERLAKEEITSPDFDTFPSIIL